RTHPITDKALKCPPAPRHRDVPIGSRNCQEIDMAVPGSRRLAQAWVCYEMTVRKRAEPWMLRDFASSLRRSQIRLERGLMRPYEPPVPRKLARGLKLGASFAPRLLALPPPARIRRGPGGLTKSPHSGWRASDFPTGPA